MSIGDFLHPPGGGPPFPGESPACADEGGLREDLSFAPLLPRMRSLLDELNRTEGPASVAYPVSASGGRASTPLLDTLGNNVLLLQDSFAERLYESLRQWGVNTSDKLTLRLDDEARLRLEGEHPQKERILEMLEALPDFSQLFAEIAVQSAALRDLRNLWVMTMYDRVQDSYVALAAAALHSHYQISLKGEMNHFYFTK